MNVTDLTTVVGFLRIVVGLGLIAFLAWWLPRRHHRQTKAAVLVRSERGRRHDRH